MSYVDALEQATDALKPPYTLDSTYEHFRPP